MAANASFRTTPLAGVAGGVVNPQDATIITRVCEDTAAGFGKIVMRGTAESQAKLYAAANATALGVICQTNKQANSDGTVTYNQYEPMNIMTRGSINVVPEKTITAAGTAVWVRHTIGTASAAQSIGSFTDSSVTSAAATAITGMVYDTATDSDGIALVRFNLPQ